MKYFKTYEGYKLGVNGVGSLRNSLAALKRQNVNGRYVDPEILAQAIRNEYEAITGEKYEDEVQMSMDNTIADIIGHYKLDGPDFMAAWDKVVKESINEASDQQRLTHLRKFGIAPNNQPQNGAYIKQVAKPGKFFVDWKDAFDLGDVALEFVKSVGSISEFDIIDLKTMKRTGKQLDVKKGQLGNLRTTYGVRVNESVNEAKDSVHIKKLTDTFDKFKLPKKYEIMMDSLFGGGSKIAVLRKRNTYGGGAMIDTHRKDGGSNYEGFIEILSSRSGRPIPGKSKFDNIDDAMKAATKFVDSIKESVTDASNNLEKIFGTDQETMDMFQGIEDKGTIKDMIEFIDEFGNEEMLSRYGIKSSAQVKKLAKTIMNESYKGNFTDFKYDLEMAIDNMDISPKAIKSVKKKGKGYEVRLSSYMSDKSTWEKIGDTIGATLISFKPGSINIGIYE